jgi:hypothetical protein
MAGPSVSLHQSSFSKSHVAAPESLRVARQNRLTCVPEMNFAETIVRFVAMKTFQKLIASSALCLFMEAGEENHLNQAPLANMSARRDGVLVPDQ